MEKNENNNQQFHYLDVVTVAFTVILVLSNIASSAKIIDGHFSIGGVPFSFDAGTVFFPFAYIVGDVLTEVYGYSRSRRVIWIGFAGLVFTFGMFLLIQKLPGESSWLSSVGQDAFNKIFSGLSSGGLVLASLFGYLAGSFSNATIMAIMKHKTKGAFLWVRTISSTLVGEFLDTLFFVLIAILTRVFAKELFFSLLLSNYIFKVFIEVICTPLTYLVVGKLKKLEGMDSYSNLKDLGSLGF